MAKSGACWYNFFFFDATGDAFLWTNLIKFKKVARKISNINILKTKAHRSFYSDVLWFILFNINCNTIVWLFYFWNYNF